MTTPTTRPDDDFLDDRAFGPSLPPETPADGAPAPTRRRIPAPATAGWLVAGLVAGAVGVMALHSSHSTAATNPAAATGGLPGGSGSTGLTGPGPGGSGPGGSGPGGTGPGGLNGAGGFAGEQRLMGTLTNVSGSTVTVATSSGTASYTIDASTQLVKNGQPVSSLAAMSAGDTVVVHVYPLNGATHVERVIDGVPGGTGTTGTTGTQGRTQTT